MIYEYRRGGRAPRATAEAINRVAPFSEIAPISGQTIIFAGGYTRT